MFRINFIVFNNLCKLNTFRKIRPSKANAHKKTTDALHDSVTGVTDFMPRNKYDSLQCSIKVHSSTHIGHKILMNLWNALFLGLVESHIVFANMDDRLLRYSFLLRLVMTAAIAYGVGITGETSMLGAPSVVNPRSYNSSMVNHGTLVSSVCTEIVLAKAATCNDKGLDLVPNNLQPDIQRLEMSRNKIRKLSDTSFSQYSLLSHLDLSYNLIRVIEAETFKQLHLLTDLNLGHNPNLHNITSDLFRWSRQVLTLSLEDTGLAHFPDNIMKWLPNLQDLRLRNNNLTSIRFDSCPARNANTSVYLCNNQISALTSETISINNCHFRGMYLIGNPVKIIEQHSLSNLRTWYFSLGGNTMTLDSWRNALSDISQSEIMSLAIDLTGIKYIPRDLFDSFRTHSPSFLHISGRGSVVDDMHPQAFTNVSGLYELTMSNTNLTSVRADYFSGMRQLQRLRISNRMAFIKPSKTAWDNPNLLTIDLSYNNLREIKPYTFRGLTALKILTLCGNEQLAVFEITSFSGLKNLAILDLSDTYIQRLCLEIPLLESFLIAGSRLGFYALALGKTFEFTKSLKEISLANTNLQTGELYFRNISLFQGLHNLTSLNLRRNPLHRLLSDMFVELPSLEYLDLGDSDIWDIPLGTFRGLKSLQTICLDNNLIQEVTFDLLKDLPLLRILVIYHNDISYLDSHLFRNNSFLSSINVANNHLVGFNRSTFEDVSSSLVEVDISGNPLVCDCALQWLAEWLAGPVQTKQEQETICSDVSSTLRPLRGKAITMLASSDLCSSQIKQYMLAALSILAVVVIMVVTYWHRWFIRHKLFLLKLAVIGYKEVEDDRNYDDFEYALNIMFTDDCDEWVQQNLRPFLEGIFPDVEKVVFGDDDLKLGMYVLDAILYAVEHSFKTVLLLSRAAVQDHWFMLKFRLAMDYATDIGTENLILIFVEEVLDDELPYLVRLFLSGSGSYLTWVEDEEGQEYFWKQLEKHLNVNRKINHLIPGQ